MTPGPTGTLFSSTTVPCAYPPVTYEHSFRGILVNVRVCQDMSWHLLSFCHVLLLINFIGPFFLVP